MDVKRHAFLSPLRYPGGKGMLANFMKLVMRHNKLLDGHYVEAYAGGASIAWSLLFSEYVQYVHINDIDPAIYAFWNTVLHRTEDLCRMIRDTAVNMHTWLRQRQILRRPDNHSETELGFATFFMNRTNRSGIIKGGVIGGKNQNGQWKLDARFNKEDLIDRIIRIARYSTRIKLYRLDAAQFFQNLISVLPIKSLFYLDPPYYTKGQDLYEHHYSYYNHVMISRLLYGVSDRVWIVTYDAAPQIIRLYRGYQHVRYRLSYSARERYSGQEIMFFSHGTVAPKVANPAWVTSAMINRDLSIDYI